MDMYSPDIPRYFTALAEWGACLLLIFQVKRCFHGWRLAGISAFALFVQAVFLTMTDGIRTWPWIPVMAAAVLLMIGFVCFCISGSLFDAIYCGLQAFIIAEFTASLEWQLYLFFFQGDTADPFIRFAFMICLYTGTYVAITFVYRNHQPASGFLQVSAKELYSVGIIAISVFAISNISFLNIDTPFSAAGASTVSIIRTMVDFSGVIIMYAYHVQRIEAQVRLEQERKLNFTKTQLLQNEQSKKNSEIIEIMHHDIKHHISILRAETDLNKIYAYLDQMAKSHHQYEPQNKTGNNVVDTMLNGPSVLCKKYGISLNYVIDGKLLGFMDEMDICSILGNAVDNAIEYEQKIQDPEKRLIQIAIFSQKNFLIMQFENYFEGELIIKKGLPLSEKRKKGSHGYGLKSIQCIVKKYDGKLTLDTRKNWFELSILIPFPTMPPLKK